MVTVKEVHNALKAHVKNCDERNGRIERGLDACNTGIGEVHARISRMGARHSSTVVKVLLVMVAVLTTAVLGMSWDLIGG